ncbi:MAG: DNA mismatch repair protein [Bacteroidetes bacterium]|nr:DNA mismatch repair protein [Bacteroidota bacterium]
MHFITDRQTLDDLNIFGKHGDGAVYGIFNHTQTRGGAMLLEQLFHEPLSRPEAIRRRSGCIRFFADAGVSFPCKPEWFDAIEQWLANTDERTKLSHEDAALGKRIAGMISNNTEQDIIYKGVAAALELVHMVYGFAATLAADGTPYAEDRTALQGLLEESVFVAVRQVPARKKLGFEQAAELDDQLRFRHRATVRRLLEKLYYLDLYLTVARVAVARKFCFPTVLEADAHTVKFRGLYHPALANPVSNSIGISPDQNVVFLTGANMAGKSTFMKSLGIAVYLAHMGFPVAAAEMEFSVLDGLFTTINLADNLGMGASHFYAEVLRVKKVAEELNRGRNLLVIFDELFRGTNVKDAYEATIAITGAFATKRNSIFVISTHIIEAGEVLRERYGNIGFIFLPTRMDGSRPVYTYQLERGITDDRHGMVIIRNEGVLDILKNGNYHAI